MDFDFSLILVVLTAIAGIIWLIDHFVFARPRSGRLAEFLAERRVGNEDFQRYLQSLDKNSTAEAGKPTDPARKAVLEQALALHRDPAPVEYAKSLFPILLAVLLLRSFVLEPFQIPSPSMVPTLNVGDFIAVNKFAYGLRLPVTGTKILDIGEPKRGDVMVFVPPHDPRYFIKRVIGLPGDHVRYADNVVYINHEPLGQDEGMVLSGQGVKLSLESVGGLTHDIHTHFPPRARSGYKWLDAEGSVRDGWLQPEGMIVPERHYFMMGDNRDDSEDSRYWGPASATKIVGKAVAVWMHKEPGWHLPVFGQNRLIENPP